MSVGRRLQTYPGIRFDAPYLRSIESSVSYDFDSLCRGLVTGLQRPYLIRGFKIVIPSSNIPASALQVQVADSAILHSSAAESGTILTLPAGIDNEVLDSSNSKVLGSFQNGVPNYVSLEYIRSIDEASADQTSGWSQTQRLELQRIVPIARILSYRFVISTTGFSTNLPLYIVGVSVNGTVDYITKAAPGLFRLGSGGTVPNPQNSFTFKNLINPQTGTNREWVNTSSAVSNPMSVVPGNPAEAFSYGDWSIESLKEWMDAIMTRIRSITGSSYWYTDSSVINPPNIPDVWFDAAGSVLTGSGQISYNYILESTDRISGAYESSFTDSEILPGDSYVIGATSGRRGTISSFNGNQLIVNSLTGTGFIPGETLYNRRLWDMNFSYFQLTNYADAVSRYASLQRESFSPGTPVNVASWVYDADAVRLQKVTVTAAAHGFLPGQIVLLAGLTASTGAPNGPQWIREVTTNTFSFLASEAITGSAGVTAATATPISSDKHPYQPRFAYTWSYVGSTITLSGFSQKVPVRSTFAQVGDTTNADPEVILTDTSDMRVGQHVVGTGIPADTYILSVDSATQITLTKDATATGSPSLSFFDVIVVTGATATTNAPNGRWDVTTVTSLGDIQFTAASIPTGTAGVSSPLLYPDYYEFLVTVENAVPAAYNVADVKAISNGPASFYYVIGSSGLPPQPDASGAIEIDGVVATATVADPVQIQQITYNGGDLDVDTYTPHGLQSSASTTVTIFGNPSITGYAQTYQNVDVTVNSATSFTISPTPSSIPQVFPNLGTFINAGSDLVFLNFPNNPYAGPIQWNSDLIIKGIIGDKAFRVPVTATAEGTPQANRFNTGGVTGTAFLQDGEVAYIKLLRNLPVSNGASFNCVAPTAITGTNFQDVDGNPLEVGDFVKFDDEDEGKWIRIGSFSGPTQANLLNDNGQPPTAVQRPPKTGQLVYAKGTYNVVTVKPHYLVEASTDVYWLAVRRDNGSPLSKVYFRNLELEVGETRSINDNEPTNLLIYTGAMTESAVNPNYSTKGSGPWALTEDLEIDAVNLNTRTVTFTAPPQLKFQKEDRFVKTISGVPYTFSINYVVSDLTVSVREPVAVLAQGDAVVYYRLNYSINDSDNLTFGIRKEDRELAKINTQLTRPIYDESCFVQRISLDAGAGVVRSGRYIYAGSLANPTGLAWVMHGTEDVTETIDGVSVAMPGGHPSVGPNAILVHILAGAAAFTDGSTLLQINMANNSSVNTARTIDNPGDPAFPAPTIAGAPATGVALVLPPNRRTQVLASGGGYEVWPSDSYYKASTVDALTGEDLLVIANDQIREAGLDYEEVFAGPKAVIRIVRSLPVNTRIRSRTTASYGSVLASTGGGTSLQIAYNNGNTINELAGVPVEMTAGDAASGGSALKTNGSIEINGDDGGGNIVGGLKGSVDKGFLIGSEANKPKEAWTALAVVKSHDNSPGSGHYSKTADVTTTIPGATTVAGSNIAMPDNAVLRVNVTAVARETSNLGQASFRMEAAFQRSGGAPVLLGSPTTTVIGGSGTGLTYAIGFGLVGNDIVIVAYGDSTAVYWAVAIDYQIIQAAS